jgi:hypothetical protein
MGTTVRDRIGAALGAAFVVLIFIGNSLSTSGTDQSSHPSGESVLRDVIKTHNSTSATIGFTLEVLGFVAFIGFLGFLADVTRRYAGSWRMPSATAVVAGTVMLAIKLGSAAPMVALELDRHTLTPQLAQLLNDMNGGAFVVSWLPFAVFVLATALALRTIGAAGRPTYWIGVFLGVAGVALTLVGLRDVTNANPMAFLLGSLWLVVVSIRLAVKPVTGEPATVTAPETRVAVNA